jgi:hypothetical protein
MTLKSLRDGETVLITCESCEPELAVVICQEADCSECFGPTYRLRTETRMVVECCASILRPLH